MDEHNAAPLTAVEPSVLQHEAPAAAEERDKSESVDLEGWAIVDDHAEIVGVEPKSAASDAVTHTDDEALVSADAAASTEQHAHETARQQQQQSGDSNRVTEVIELRSEPHDPVAPDTAHIATPDSESTAASAEPMSVPDGSLRIRLRVGEHVRPAWCHATQIVGDFTAAFFGDAVAEGKKVRLIYMGMLLGRDRAMGEYGIEEDGVIHCVISEAPHTPHAHASQPVTLKGLSNPASMLLAVTGVALYGLWTLLYHFPHLFSWKSIVLLSLFSAAHISATLSRFSTSS